MANLQRPSNNWSIPGHRSGNSFGSDRNGGANENNSSTNGNVANNLVKRIVRLLKRMDNRLAFFYGKDMLRPLKLPFYLREGISEIDILLLIEFQLIKVFF